MAAVEEPCTATHVEAGREALVKTGNGGMQSVLCSAHLLRRSERGLRSIGELFASAKDSRVECAPTGDEGIQWPTAISANEGDPGEGLLTHQRPAGVLGVTPWS